MTQGYDLRAQIVDEAIALAEERSWEAVRLHEVAARLGITLEDIRLFFREKEDITDAWFDRADVAALQVAISEDLSSLPVAARLEGIIMGWLDVLAPHRRVTRQMILGKLEPGHLHIQIPGVMRISRTVQWFREAAGLRATYLSRALAETGLTTVYLCTFAHWMTDDSPESRDTRRALRRWLGRAEVVANHWFAIGRSPLSVDETARKTTAYAVPDGES